MKKWHLDLKEVTWGTSIRWRDTDEFDVVINPDAKHNQLPSGPGYRHGLKQPRSFNKTSFSIVITHVPTGIEVHGRYVGYYSRKEQKNMRDLLGEKLLKVLEEKVGKHLKIAGR